MTGENPQIPNFSTIARLLICAISNLATGILVKTADQT